jgi:hypothetical protein
MEGDMETQIIKKNEEFCEVLNDLEERRMFGEVTFYFQNGVVESCRISERLIKKDLKERKKVKSSVKDIERLMLDKSCSNTFISRKGTNG